MILTFKIKKSHGILRFLNQKHNIFTSICFGCAGWIATFLSTRSLALSNEMYWQFYQGSFKIAGRRSGWYLRISWLNLNIADDPFYNFTEELSPRLVDLQEKYLDCAKRRIPKEIYWGNKIVLSASRCHSALENNDQKIFIESLRKYCDQADKLLETINLDELSNKQPTPSVPSIGDFKEVAPEVLADFENLVPRSIWKWFVTGGTFLGAVREQHFISHDFDIDVGIFATQSQILELEKIFENSDDFGAIKQTYQADIRYSHGNFNIEKLPGFMKLIHRSGVNLDIFFHHSDGDICSHGSGVMRWENKCFGLSEYLLGDVTVYGPNDADTYLTEHYGNWRVEKKEFSCVADTTNISYSNNLFTRAFLVKRFTQQTQTDAKDLYKVFHDLLTQGIIVERCGKFLINRDYSQYQPDRSKR